MCIYSLNPSLTRTCAQCANSVLNELNVILTAQLYDLVHTYAVTIAIFD